MEQNGEDRSTSPTEEAGLKNTQAQTETDCNKDEEYTSSEAKHNGVDEDKEKSEKVRYHTIFIVKICICLSVSYVNTGGSGGAATPEKSRKGHHPQEAPNSPKKLKRHPPGLFGSFTYDQYMYFF